MVLSQGARLGEPVWMEKAITQKWVRTVVLY